MGMGTVMVEALKTQVEIKAGQDLRVKEIIKYRATNSMACL